MGGMQQSRRGIRGFCEPRQQKRGHCGIEYTITSKIFLYNYKQISLLLYVQKNRVFPPSTDNCLRLSGGFYWESCR